MPEIGVIFVVKSRNGKEIRLTNAQWKHVSYRHPEMVNLLKDIEETIKNPTSIRKHSEAIMKFYKFIKNKKKYLMVAVKVLNGEGFVVTSYFTTKIQKENVSENEGNNV